MGFVFDRILFFLYGLSIAVLSAVFIVLTFDVISISQVEDALYTLHTSRLLQIIALFIALIFILISLRLVYRSIRSNPGLPRTVDQRNEIGDVKISLDTIENLALKAASQVRSLQNVKARIHLEDQGLEIEIKAYVDGQDSIPERTEEAQRTIKQYLEDITGIPVAKVSVFIANIASQQPMKSRVE